MPLIPLDIPPGFRRGGTELQAAGRWYDGSLVRWRDGAMQPIGGWSERADAVTTNPPRGAYSWMENAGTRWLSFGTADKLYVMSEGSVITDITPVGLVAGNASSTVNTGYGGSFYGLSTYGTERPASGATSAATTWAMDSWGEYLIACSNADRTIWEWTLNTANDAVAVTNAPTASSVLVTDERFLFALGAGSNPRTVQWSDREDRNTWTPATTNEAGSFQIEGGARIMCGVKLRGQTLILTDRTAHAATYIGPPFVYGFEKVGDACGAISRRAAASADGGAFWMGRGGFYSYAGGSVQPVPCEVLDYVIGGYNTSQASKIYAVSNALFGEVWWFYPSQGATECDSYVAYNYREGHWLIGSINRTCGVDSGAFGNPLWLDSAGVIYSQEVGGNHDGATIYAESGPINFGETVATALQMFPDERTQGDVQAYFKARYYPNATETTYGPYAMGEPTHVRFTGRQMRLRVEAANSSDWRVGVNQLKVQPRGMR